MKKPIKPIKPIEPTKSTYIDTYNPNGIENCIFEIPYNHTIYSLEKIIDYCKNNNLIPALEHFESEYFSDYTEGYKLIFLTEKTNKKYKKQYLLYLEKLNIYNTKLIKYEKNLANYEKYLATITKDEVKPIKNTRNNSYGNQSLIDKIKNLSKEDVLKIAVKAGIHNKDGTLTEFYGGKYTDDDSPSKGHVMTKLSRANSSVYKDKK